MKKAGFGLLTALLAGVIAFAAGEIAVRVLMPQEDSVQWVASSEKYGHVLKKNFRQSYRFPSAGFTMQVRTNSLGMRDEEPGPVSKDSKRILFLGDSFVFGHGVNIQDRFDTRLDKLLTESGGRRYELMNAGVTGWGTLQETAYGRDSFELLRPDIIVLTFCGNDSLDDTRFTHGMSDDERGLYYFPGKIFLRDHSHLFRLVYVKLKTLLYNRIVRKRVGNIEQKGAGLTVAGDEGGKAVDVQTGTVISAQDWERSLRAIKGFYEDFRSFNPDGVLLVQATAPWNEGIRERLITLKSGKSLIYVDMFEETSELSSDERKLPFDGHWSPKVHSISAKKLFETISALDKEAG